MTFKCKKCGHEKYLLKTQTGKTDNESILNESQVGLYCADCGFWHKWVSKDVRKHYLIQVEKKPTNREWLQSLSDEDMAFAMYNKVQDVRYDNFYGTVNKFKARKDLIEWLKAEREEVNYE